MDKILSVFLMLTVGAYLAAIVAILLLVLAENAPAQLGSTAGTCFLIGCGLTVVDIFLNRFTL